MSKKWEVVWRSLMHHLKLSEENVKVDAIHQPSHKRFLLNRVVRLPMHGDIQLAGVGEAPYTKESNAPPMNQIWPNSPLLPPMCTDSVPLPSFKTAWDRSVREVIRDALRKDVLRADALAPLPSELRKAVTELTSQQGGDHRMGVRQLVDGWYQAMDVDHPAARRTLIQHFPPPKWTRQRGMCVPIDVYRQCAVGPALRPHAAWDALDHLERNIDIEPQEDISETFMPTRPPGAASGAGGHRGVVREGSRELGTGKGRGDESGPGMEYYRRSLVTLERERASHIIDTYYALLSDPYEGHELVRSASFKQKREARFMVEADMSHVSRDDLCVLIPRDEDTSRFVSDVRHIHGDAFDYSAVHIAPPHPPAHATPNVRLTCLACEKPFDLPPSRLLQPEPLQCPSCGHSSRPTSGVHHGGEQVGQGEGGVSGGRKEKSRLRDAETRDVRDPYRFCKRDEAWVGQVVRIRQANKICLLQLKVHPILISAQDPTTTTTPSSDPHPLAGSVPVEPSYWVAWPSVIPRVFDRQLRALRRIALFGDEYCSESVRKLILSPSGNPVGPLQKAAGREPAGDGLGGAGAGAGAGGDEIQSCFPELSAGQRDAVRSALSSREPICLIRGPPGTGKTATAAAIVAMWATSDPTDCSPIYACAGTHAAVAQLKRHLLRWGIRPSNPRDHISSSHSRDTATASSADEAAENPEPDGDSVGGDGEEGEAISDGEGARGGESGGDSDGAGGECGGGGGRRQHAHVFVQTVYQASIFARRELPRVLIDESTQISEYAALIPLAQRCRKLLLIGDPAQLPPLSPLNKQVYGERHEPVTSLFDKLQKQGLRPVSLTVQHRMPPVICSFLSKHFYRGNLHTDSLLANNPPPLPSGFPWARSADDPSLPMPVLFIDTHGGGYLEELRDRSLMNPLESSVCAAVVRRLQQLGVPASEIGVITPYDSHKRLLKRAIHGMLDLLELEPHPHVLTVDGFQGSERDFIVFSAVRSNLQASLGFLKDERRMCVALSRCKRALIMVGDSKTLSSHPIWQEWVAYVDSLGCRVSYGTFMRQLHQAHHTHGQGSMSVCRSSVV
ncbi:unnamed protein product [Vitrella brassicaformis CCMP3155]|uniref:AAA+ ATPase domain-containing protein n=2 Tax=Vitrella brassicaformis TaxID=1169539 RepID=A0A0G4EGY8_VITBC|nr:unnamed protein product [Vitrella brassicaformis CCMP3155]|eukprot:CEL95507.1 unnamed protein product [Vitrella brassicaformis CCMP3155]